MNRLGFRIDEAAAAIERLGQLDSIGELRVMTHLSCADDPENAATAEQIENFFDALGDFDGPISVANSPAALGFAPMLRELAARRGAAKVWIRPGLALYGISPITGVSATQLGLVPAMQFESQLVAVKRLAAGDRVGYGGTWHAPSDTMLGIVAAGYGDGYVRHVAQGTPVLINGRRVPVVGRVSMDLCAVDLGVNAMDSVADPVTLWGSELPVEEIAAAAKTIAYTLVCGITDRVERRYLD